MLFLALATSTGLARVAQADTFLFLDSEAGDSVGGGTRRLFSPNDGSFSVGGRSDTYVNVDFRGPGSAFWTLFFSPPVGGMLVPGVYEGVARSPSATPGLDVSGEGHGCGETSGRFVVLEAVYGAEPGQVQSFAADFEQHCDGASAALFGAIRFRAGDLECTGQVDGTVCNDHNECTQLDACRAGLCASASPLDCTPTSRCEAAGSLCRPGICVGGPPPGCEDGNFCTDDTCDLVMGCLNVVRGSCWSLSGRLRATACLGGQCARESGAFTGALLLRDDRTYRIAAPGQACPGGATVTDEVGTWRPGRRGRLVLDAGNETEISESLLACLEGLALRVRRYRHSLTIDGGRLSGVSRLRGSIRVRGQTVPVRVVVRYEGALAGG